MGVSKKAREPSTLCGIKACAIIFPKGGDSSSQMQVRPPLPEATSMPETDQRKKTMDAEGYVRERIGKIQEQLRKAERDKRQRETTLLLHDAMVGRRANLHGLAVEQLAGTGWTTSENLIKQIKDVIAYGSGQPTGMKTDAPLPYAATAAVVEAPQPRRPVVGAGATAVSGPAAGIGGGGDGRGEDAGGNRWRRGWKGRRWR